MPSTVRVPAAQFILQGSESPARTSTMHMPGPARPSVCVQDHAAFPSLRSLIVVPLWVLITSGPFECCLVLTQNTLTLPLVSCSTQKKESCPRLQPHLFMSRCPRRCSTLGTRHRQAPQILPGSQSSAAGPRCRQTLCRTGCLPAEIPALFSGKAFFRRPCPAHGASDNSSSHAISVSNL